MPIAKSMKSMKPPDDRNAPPANTRINTTTAAAPQPNGAHCGRIGLGAGDE
jgi:hypothetical protein